MQDPRHQRTDSLNLRGWRGLLTGGLVLALIIVVASWLTPQQVSNTLGSAGNQESLGLLQPTSTADDVVWQVFQPSGELNYEIRASNLEQFSEQQYVSITKPAVLMYDEGKHPWRMFAQTGIISAADSTADAPKTEASQEALLLSGDVVLVQAETSEGSTGPTLRMETSALNVYPHRKQAFTQSQALVSHSRFVITSQGLDLNLQTGTLRFTGDQTTRVVSKLFLPTHSKDS